jgi:hypothetical protein
MKSVSKILIALLAVLLVNVNSAMACIYGPPYSTVCEKYAEANTVIIGKIVRVKPHYIATKFGPFQNTQTVKIKVSKTFKGQSKRTILLTQPQSTCDWDFQGEIGKTLLLYLHKNGKTKQFSAIGSGSGGEIDRKAEDLYWLKGLPQSLKRTRISGTIELYQDEPFSFSDHMIGAKVKISNENQSFQVTTDKNGVYEIWDIPIGKYKIMPDFTNFKDGFKLGSPLSKGNIAFKTLSETQVDTSDFTVEMQPNSCGGYDYYISKTQ